MSEQLPLTNGCWARVRLRPGCDGDGRPHHPSEHGARVKVAIGRESVGHRIWANWKGAPWSVVSPPPGGLGIGRHFSADELDVLPPDRIDPTPEEEAERFRAKWGPMPGGGGDHDSNVSYGTDLKSHKLR